MFRKVWKATKASVQTEVLDTVLAPYKLSKGEKKKELEKANKLNEEKAIDPKASKKDRPPELLTTASLAVEEVCNRIRAGKVKEIAASEEAEKFLESECGKGHVLAELFRMRKERVQSSTNIEISLEKGSDTDTRHRPPKPLKAVYSEEQYESVKKLYLQAALQAGVYPEITTHFWVDKDFTGGHADPRCFNLKHLYEIISATLGHSKGSVYGIYPINYGTTSGTYNVWWNDIVCHGPPPK